MHPLVATFLLLFANGVNNHETQTAQYKTHYEQHHVAASVLNTVWRFAVQEPHTQTKQNETYDPYRDHLYRAYLAFTVVGVIGAMVGICVIYLQTKATQEAATAAKESADAALLNATALKNAERAHVDADFVRMLNALYNFTATNLGKSPAIILVWTFARYSFAAMPSNQMPDELTIEKGVSRIHERHAVNQMLAVGPPATVLQVDISHYLSEEQLSGKQIALFGGSIMYQDIFGDRHETEVVYSYQVTTGKLVNQPRYNRYT